MQFFPILSLCLVAKVVSSVENSSKVLHSAPAPGLQLSLRWGASCEDNCAPEIHIVCRNSTCVCDSPYPVYLEQNRTCSKAILLGGECEYDEECRFADKHAYCHVFTSHFRECDCRDEFEIKEIAKLKPPRFCYPVLTDKDVPTFLGFGLGLSLMSAMICLALRIYSGARFARPRRYANAAIPPPLTVSETYAAFALTHGQNGRGTPVEYRPISIGSASSSRRPSYISMQQHRPSGNLYRLGSSSSIPVHKSGSRRPSAASVKSFRSQSGQLLLSDLHPEPDHYIVYMFRGPSRSVASDSTNMTNCESGESVSPRSSDQHSPAERGAVGKSYTTASFRTISSEDVFEEEDEDLEDEDLITDSNRI